MYTGALVLAVLSALPIKGSASVYRQRGNCSADAPSMTQPMFQESWLEPKETLRVGDAYSQPVDADDSITPLVVHLRNQASPAAIGFGVRTIVVNAVQLSSTWPRSHVSKERGERVSPFGAHGNAAPTVIGVGPVLRVVASVFSSVPDVVLAGIAEAVLPMSWSSPFVSKAPAAGTVSVSQRDRSGDHEASAVASALPKRGRGLTSDLFLCRTPEYKKTAEPLVCQVDEVVRHEKDYRRGVCIEAR